MLTVVHLTTVHRPFDTRIFQKECRIFSREKHRATLVAPYSTREVVKAVEIVPTPGLDDRLVRGAHLSRRIWRTYRKTGRLLARCQGDLR